MELKNVGEQIIIIEQILRKSATDEKSNELEEYLRTNPAFGHRFIEIRQLEIQKKLTEINLIALTLSYLVGKNKS